MNVSHRLFLSNCSEWKASVWSTKQKKWHQKQLPPFDCFWRWTFLRFLGKCAWAKQTLPLSEGSSCSRLFFVLHPNNYETSSNWIQRQISFGFERFSDWSRVPICDRLCTTSTFPINFAILDALSSTLGFPNFIGLESSIWIPSLVQKERWKCPKLGTDKKPVMI